MNIKEDIKFLETMQKLKPKNRMQAKQKEETHLIVVFLILSPAPRIFTPALFFAGGWDSLVEFSWPFLVRSFRKEYLDIPSKKMDK